MSEVEKTEVAQTHTEATEVTEAPVTEQTQTDAGTPAKPDAKPEQVKEEEKPEAAKPVAPEKYDLKLPENSLLEPRHVERIEAAAKARGLSNQDAQAELERASAEVEAETEKVKAQWLNETMNDKEIGGDAFKQTATISSKVVDRFATPGLKAILDKTGYGNHPDWIKFCVRIGKEFGDDQLVVPGAQAGGKKPIEDIFYGSDNKE